MSGTKDQHPLDDENPERRISHPVAEPFEHSSNMGDSHHLEVLNTARFHEDRLDLWSQRGVCGEIGHELKGLEIRLQSRVGNIPHGSIELEEWDQNLKRGLEAAHQAVREVLLAIIDCQEVMAAERRPCLWQSMDQRTLRVRATIKKNEWHFKDMYLVLSGLEDMLFKIEGLTNSDMTELKRCLDSFVWNLGDWR